MSQARSQREAVDFQATRRRYIPEDGTVHYHGCEDLKLFLFLVFVFSGTASKVRSL
jgi:hypothetical protein